MDKLKENIHEASKNIRISPPQGHEERFLKLLSMNENKTGDTAATTAADSKRRPAVFRQILAGAAAASLLWIAAYTFIGVPREEPDPFGKKMAGIEAMYKQELERMSNSIRNSVHTPEERLAVEKGLRSFEQTQAAFERDIASSLPRSPHGIDVLHKHYATSVEALKDFRRRVNTSKNDPEILLIN